MMTKSAAFTIVPVELGRRTAESSAFLYLTDPGIPVDIAYRIWVLKSATRTILVDTGPPPEESARRGMLNVEGVVPALARVGVDAVGIDTVLLTHLHWDHAGNARQFPKATFHAQKSEIEFFQSKWRSHPSVGRFFSDCDYLDGLIGKKRLQPIEGNVELFPGIRTIRVGGHTLGSQMLLVTTAEGPAIIAGDVVPLIRNYRENIPAGILVNTLEAIDAIENARNLRPASIYPGHDVVEKLVLETSYSART